MPSVVPHIAALPRSDGREERLTVQRLTEMLTTLVTAQGHTLLCARASRDGRRFDIFVSHDGRSALGDKAELADPVPAFVLAATDAKSRMWALLSSRCSSCESAGRMRCGVSCIARIRQYTEAIGAGDVYCMDVELPRGRGSLLAGSACAACQVAGCDVQ